MTTPTRVFAGTADVKASLQSFQAQINADIDDYCTTILGNWERDYSPYSSEVLSAFCEVLQRGGKRVRGALVMTSYHMFGGHDLATALRAARVVEIAHAYMLIADDICDRSDLRRGGPSAHKLLQRTHEEQKLHGDSAHFGVSQALNAALAGSELARQELVSLSVDAERKVLAMQEFHHALTTTVNGQMNDIFNEALQDVNEAQVLNTLQWKTAHYSFLYPLQLGAILATGDLKKLDGLADYALNLGLSFQLIDDVLGTFGDEFESGKSAQDDLKEGKVTVLISKALQLADTDQKRHLLSILGQPNLTGDDFLEAKRIIEQTGALAYTKQLADSYADKALAALDHAPSDWDAGDVDFLRALAHYVTRRRS